MFGSNDRELLHQILRELAELRQQVTGQQHAIDQARQDHAGEIRRGLEETRNAVGVGLDRIHQTIASPLSDLHDQLAAIRRHINASDQTPREPEGNAEAPAQSADSSLLTAAAGISAAELQMHRDTWAFLLEQTAGDQHFHIPGKVDDDDGAVIVRVSGPSLVAAITSLDQVNRTAPNPVTRAIAGHLHKRITETVEEIIDRPHRGDGAKPVRIVIDDRAASVGNDQPERDD